MAPSETPRRVAVIGAGIIGVNCALSLGRDGHDVTLIDRAAPGQGCSFGNAGLLARSSFVPLSSPATLRQVPAMLLNPNGPLSIRWRYLPWLAPWLVKFIRAGFEDAEKRAAALQQLTDPSVELYLSLAAEAGIPDLVRRTDYLYVYRTRAGFEKDAAGFALRQQLGVRIRHVGADELRALEPALSPDFKYAYQLMDHGFTPDPEALVQGLARLFEAEGGKVVQTDVRDIAASADDGPVTVESADGSQDFDAVVIAAGAFSSRLSSKIGVAVPLETERGYHAVFPDPGVTLNCPMMDAEAKFLVTPMNMGLRAAGTVELAGLDAPPTAKRVKSLVAQAAVMLPDLNTEGHSEWMGHRPTLPDSLPVVGPAPRAPGVYLAFGHQHVGLTCGPKTGSVIADLVAGRAPNSDIRPFRAESF